MYQEDCAHTRLLLQSPCCQSGESTLSAQVPLHNNQQVELVSHITLLNTLKPVTVWQHSG